MSKLSRVFLIKEAAGKKLGPKQEKLVKDYAHEIVTEFSRLVGGNSGRALQNPAQRQAMENILRELLVASEQAEGEPASDLDEGDEIDYNKPDMTQAQAKAQVEKIGGSWDSFVKDNGNKPKYSTMEVMEWIGY